MMARTDEQLMLTVAGGDLTALTELVSRHRERAIRFCFRLTGDWVIAEDLAHEGFVRLCSLSQPYRARAKFTTFLYGILKNLCIDELRWQQRRHGRWLPYDAETLDNVPDPGPPPDECAERHETIAAVRGFLAGLPPDSRTALVLREFEGLTYQEIGDLMGWTLAKTKVTLHRARERLLKELEEGEAHART